MIDRYNLRGSVSFMSADFPLISEHAVLADRLDGFLLAVDVVPPRLLQVPILIRHKLHLNAVLKGNSQQESGRNGQQSKSRSFICLDLVFVFVVGHDVRIRDVDPVVVLAVNRTAVHFLVGVSPGQDCHESHSYLFTSKTRLGQSPI